MADARNIRLGLVFLLITGAAFAQAPVRDSEPPPSRTVGSVYVPLDSWIYGALDRLAALGLIPSQISGLRPWTEQECLRQAREAEANLDREQGSDNAAELVSALIQSLRDRDGASVRLQSVYTRNGFIAGPMLNDSFHFGQTWTNDNGRPFGRGWNSYSGFTASAQAGRFFAYLNGEYQHAPATEPYPLSVREAIAAMDGVPVEPPAPRKNTDRFRTLEGYIGLRLGPVALSAGKQSLWWGPTYDAPLSFSNNAEPTKNFRISTASPVRVWKLGDVRGEFVMGKLGGHRYTWRPWFNALKVSFKLTSNLEMGFTRWSILWGVGHHITVRSFIRNFTSVNSPWGASGVGAADPGDRKAGFDFRYRVPGLRNWLTLYTDSYCDDDPSPLANPRRAAINPGLYLSHVPGLPQLDFRLEAPSTTPLDGGWDYPGLNYFNGQYRSGNTNYGYLLGNPVGRDARAIESWSTWHSSPRGKLELGYRRIKGSSKFLPGGSTQSDVMLKGSLAVAPDVRADWFVQVENFYIPLLGPRRSNTSAIVQLTWEPDVQVLGKRK